MGHCTRSGGFSVGRGDMTLSDLMLTLRSVCALVLCALYSWLLSVCAVPEPVVMGMLWTKEKQWLKDLTVLRAKKCILITYL